MTSRERVHAALEGREVDRFPVTSLYHFLYRMDHFTELTGLPVWRRHEWLGSSPERYLELFAVMQEKTPFELLQPHSAPSRASREQVEFVGRDGHGWRHDLRADAWQQLDTPSISGHATDYHANETQRVFDSEDVRRQVPIIAAETMIAGGQNDYIGAVVSRYGPTEFILTGGVVGALYGCSEHVGLTNLFALLLEQPALIEYLCGRITEQNLETIRRYAGAGGDAIYIDDACATCDMISVAHYERFSVPYIREMVDEIHRHGLKAILIYFGGIADRLDQIASLGADGLSCECSMKGYANDLGEIAARLGDRVTLFGNMDPLACLQEASDLELEAEIRRQIEAGRRARGFIVSPASPITPATPLSRVQHFLDLARKHGCRGPSPHTRARV
jgi:uroporphyrinogen-III decarboxylase